MFVPTFSVDESQNCGQALEKVVVEHLVFIKRVLGCKKSASSMTVCEKDEVATIDASVIGLDQLAFLWTLESLATHHLALSVAADET